MQFNQVVGQSEIKRKLIESVNNRRISHAQLFLGKTGYGGLALALSYVQYISCKNRTESDSCGECSSCSKIQKLIHPDIHLSFPFNKTEQKKSKNITSDDFIQDFREALLDNPYLSLNDWNTKIEIGNRQSIINVDESQSIIKKLSFKPYESEYRFLIIWEADKLNQEAANKLLKLIEEPGNKTLIILISESEESLLKTITSRTQIMRLSPILEKDLANYLVSKKGVEENRARQIAGQSDGDLQAAINQIELNQEEAIFFELFKDWMRACYKADIQSINKWVEEISKASYGREGRKRFLEYALRLMRESILKNYTDSDLQKFYGDESQFLEKFAPFIHGDNIIAITEVLNDAHIHIGRNAYAKIVFMDMSMKFANLLRVKKRTFVS